jgi:NitT/TauT family transport system substrate-binding protein
MNNVTRRGFVAGAAAAALGLAGCGAGSSAGSDAEPTVGATTSVADAVNVRVASLKGPTSIGLLALMDKADSEGSGLANTYEFTVAGSADEVTPKVISGDIDIALVPANVASILYNKTEGAVRVLDVNTLGVLYVVTTADNVETFEDVAGSSVYLTGKGATPEYVMGYLLEKAGITDAVSLVFKSEATEVVSCLSTDSGAIAILPEPYKTVAMSKVDGLKAPVCLTEVWDDLSTDGSRLLTGVTVVRAEFAEEHPEAVAEFLEQQAASVKAVNADPATYGESAANHGIVDSAAVAEKAIPGCNLVCLTGEEMKTALSGYLDVLSQYDASSVGGALPADDFYYEA